MKFKYICPETREGKEMYSLMNKLINKFHPDLIETNIALAWNYTWKPDIDGHLTLGRCKKASDLDKVVPSPFDFIITLFHEFWHDSAVTNDQRCALLDHELCHAAVKLNNDGRVAKDEEDHVVCRIKRHDVEDFIDIIERYGVHTPQLERLAFTLRQLKKEKI